MNRETYIRLLGLQYFINILYEYYKMKRIESNLSYLDIANFNAVMQRWPGANDAIEVAVSYYNGLFNIIFIEKNNQIIKIT